MADIAGHQAWRLSVSRRSYVPDKADRPALVVPLVACQVALVRAAATATVA
jgi:hypothetical protein